MFGQFANSAIHEYSPATSGEPGCPSFASDGHLIPRARLNSPVKVAMR